MDADFQKIVDGIGAMACIVSVEKLDDGNVGKFRIVTGNKAYIETIEHPAPGTEMLTDKFTPNEEYTKYLTRDLNFEDFCYRAAVEKKCLHSYVHPDRLPVWFNMTFLPVEPNIKNLYHCIYIMEMNFQADSSRQSNISGRLAATVLETCIKLRGALDFKKTMNDVIGDIRRICEAEHCCILTLDEYQKECEVVCESFSSETQLLPMKSYLDESFYRIAKSWEATIAGSNCLIAKNEHDMEVVKERNPVWYESLKIAKAHTIVLFPLKFGMKLLGYIWAINFNPEKALEIKEVLEITTFILASELSNHSLLARLKTLSSKDMLTGIMNRNEMNNFVDALCTSSNKRNESVGVIFADLNGLKTVNDNEGHVAGDRLIKDAANVLLEIFDEEQIFRAGGDEFSVIVRNMKKEEVAKKIEKIRETAKHYDKVIFALGGWVEEDSRNVRVALHKADELMYEDKQKFYAEHPERKMR